jgi:hypothetical protein
LRGLAGARMNRSFDNPDHWRQRAEEMRRLAKDLHDLIAKATMLEVADQYERLALRAEQRLRGDKPAA